MTNQTALARRYKVEIDTAYPATASWQTLPGVVEFKDLSTPTDQRDSDYDSDGGVGYTRTALEWGLELKVSHKEDDVTYALNTVHAYLKARALSRGGQTSVVHVRYYDRRGNADAHEGYALVTWAPDGGDDEQLDRVAITFKPHSSNPILQTIASPVDETPLPVISSLDPATGAAAGGDLITIYGAYFTGATDVDFGASAAADFMVISDNAISAVTPAVAASTVRVKVTTANGESADTANDNYTFA
jgi:hypothetical protein